MPITIHAHAHNADLVIQLAAKIIAQLKDSLKYRRRASLIVSGGSTPKTLFQTLANYPLEWDRVQISLADERWVPADHPDSNARLVRENLLQNHAANAQFIPLTSPHASPFARDAEATVAENLAAIPRPFDAVILGMGTDGHTASLFPQAENLAAALDPFAPRPCVAIQPPNAPHPRMTLTLSALLDTPLLALHLFGEPKWQVLHRALPPFETTQLPISRLLNQDKTPPQVFYAAAQ
ncbi:MAG: 6-phosphogluconolactonase [Cellvibrionales bacterium]|nr:6-phosphogluconolactonase [Cellvibrionales bacterium]